MTPGAVKTVVWIVAPTMHSHCAMSSTNGRVTEIRPIDTHRYKTLAFDALDENGTAQSPDSQSVDCLWGSNTASWVGEHSENAELFGERIAIGEREPDQKVAENLCYVILWKDTADNGMIVSQRFYIDRQTFMVLRLDSAQKFEGQTIARSQHYRYSLGVELGADSWNVSPSDFEESSLGSVFEEVQIKSCEGLEIIVLPQTSDDAILRSSP